MGFAAKAWIKGLGACALSVGLSLIGAASARAELSGFAARYSSVGQLDPGFNNSGFFIGVAPGHDAFNDVVLDSMGRAVVCGHVSTSTGLWQMFAGRFRTDGTPDPDFNFFGWALVSSTQQLAAVACTIDGNGKIVVVAEEGIFGSTTTPSFYLARFNTNGTLDWSFGVGGLTQISMPGAAHVWPVDVVVTSDGKIVVGGDIDNVSGSNEAFVTRHLTGGGLDGTFGISGRARTTLGHTDVTVRGMTVDNQNRPVLTGGGGQTLMVARLTPWGTPDSGFGPGGKRYVTVLDQASSEGRGVIMDENNKVVVVGNYIYAPNGISVPMMARFDSAGVPDSGFGINGVAIRYDIPTGFVAHDIARAPDNKLLISTTGDWVHTPGKFLSVFRFLPNGTKDRPFGTGDMGMTYTFVANTDIYAVALAVDANNKTVVAGHIQMP